MTDQFGLTKFHFHNDPLPLLGKNGEKWNGQ